MYNYIPVLKRLYVTVYFIIVLSFSVFIIIIVFSFIADSGYPPDIEVMVKDMYHVRIVQHTLD